MRAALASEYRKLVSTRLWWVLLLAMIGYMAFLSATVGLSIYLSGEQAADAGAELPETTPEQIAQTLYGIAASWGYIFPVIVGALAVTGEFRHKTITPTLLAEPRRSVLLAAKFLSTIPVGLLFGLFGTATTVAAGAGVLAITGSETFLDTWVIWRGILLAVVALAVWAMVGVGLGTMLPNQVVAIVVLLAYTQFVEPVVRLVAGFVSWGPDVAKFLPGAAGDAMAGASFYDTIAGTGGSTLLTWWQGGLVLLGYAVVFGIVGRFTTFRKDIT